MSTTEHEVSPGMISSQRDTDFLPAKKPKENLDKN